MRVFLFLAVLAGSACQPAVQQLESATVAEGAANADPTGGDAASSHPDVSPHIWGISDDGRLMFAPFPSDDIDISIDCVARGRVEIVALNFTQGGKTLRLASGKKSEVFPAEVIPGDGELYPVEWTSSQILVGTDNPVLVAFRQSGVLSKDDPQEEMRPNAPDELLTIERFFADCESRSP